MNCLPIIIVLTLASLIQTGCKNHSSKADSPKKDSNEKAALTDKDPSKTADSDISSGSLNKPNVPLPTIVKVKNLSIFMKSRDDLDVSTTANQALDISLCLEGDMAFNRETLAIVSHSIVSKPLTVRILFHPSITVPSLITYIERKDALTNQVQYQSFPNRNGTYQTNFTVKNLDEIRLGISSSELSRRYFHDEDSHDKWPKPLIFFDVPCVDDGSKIPKSVLQ